MGIVDSLWCWINSSPQSINSQQILSHSIYACWTMVTTVNLIKNGKSVICSISQNPSKVCVWYVCVLYVHILSQCTNQLYTHAVQSHSLLPPITHTVHQAACSCLIQHMHTHTNHAYIIMHTNIHNVIVP